MFNQCLGCVAGESVPGYIQWGRTTENVLKQSATENENERCLSSGSRPSLFRSAFFSLVPNEYGPAAVSLGLAGI